MQLGIVVPCFNEEEVLLETSNRLIGLIADLLRKDKISEESQILFIDDGSSDRTWEIIENLSNRSPYIGGIKLSRNRGHQNALLAGLFTADGDVIVSIDADLQDDVQVIEAMVDAYRNGSDIVYGVRKKRPTDTRFKRWSAELFYMLMQAMGVNVVFNHADFRLMSRRAVEHLKEFREVNLFLRGLVPLLGFRSSVIHYDRVERYAGVSKYPLKKMLAFAFDGISSFSVVPLRIVSTAGFFIFLSSILMSTWVLAVRLLTDRAVPGWASTVLPVYFIGGIQLLSTGLIGEYIAKIYGEVKARPRYIIEKTIVGTRRGAGSAEASQPPVAMVSSPTVSSESAARAPCRPT
jgi:glycosyltransferase involved in cell wall biosynthesis